MSTARPNGEIEAARFTRWPGLLSLSAGLLVGPIAALFNQGLIYVANMWACGAGTRLALHVVPALCLAVSVGAGLLARADWARVGRGTHAEEATVSSRSRFLALSGMATSALSALVILAQWLAIFVFDPCLRA
jgi:hypothetical protein